MHQVLEAHNVALDVGARVLQRVPNPRLRREVDHAVKVVLGKERAFTEIKQSCFDDEAQCEEALVGAHLRKK